MVRFIIYQQLSSQKSMHSFTFQYGQIYYQAVNILFSNAPIIYIPIWLDLLYYYYFLTSTIDNNLHSNMVRFIMDQHLHIQIKNVSIYIPIWLDLLYRQQNRKTTKSNHLHSNMVRFIMQTIQQKEANFQSFTFQYGQIYYSKSTIINNIGGRIYIPIWLDLL